MQVNQGVAPLLIRVNPAVHHYVTTLEASHLDNTHKSTPAATGLVAFDARTQRVLELRRQIANGTYNIDHALVAAAILREQIAIEPSLASAVAASAPVIRDFSRFVVAGTPPEAQQAGALTA